MSTSPSRTCPPSRPKSTMTRLPLTVRATPRAHLGRALSALALALLLVGALLSTGSPVSAEAAIEVLISNHESRFSESFEFELQAEADLEIVEVVLFYGEVGSGIVRRIYPYLTPGNEVRFVYVEELEGGQFAPGTEMHYWWEILCEDGSTLRTDRQTFSYDDLSRDWQTVAGERVDLFWYGNNREETRAEETLEVSEAAIARLESEIGVSVDERIRVYVYNNQNHMRAALSSRSETYDDRVMTLGVTVSDDTLLLLGSHRDLDMVAAHELSHIVTGLATDNPYAGLPRWLDEGLAMYAEGEFPEDNKRALDDAVASDALLSIRSMSSYSGQADQVDLYYGEVRSVVDFMLATYGRDRMQALLGVFAEGSLAEDALQEVLGLGLDELDNAWRESLGLAPRPLPGAGAPAAQQRAPAGEAANAALRLPCPPSLAAFVRQGLMG